MSNANRAAEIELTIDELSLHGFRHVDTVSVSRTIKEELANLLAQSNGAIDLDAGNSFRLDAGSISVQGAENGEMLGVRIAQAIHRSIAEHPGSSQPFRAQESAMQPLGSTKHDPSAAGLVKNTGVTNK